MRIGGRWLASIPLEGVQLRRTVLHPRIHTELALRFLRDQSIECAGFIDTNGGADLCRYVFGRPVLGRLDDLEWLSKRHGVFEVVLPDCEQTLLPGVDVQAFCQGSELRLTKLGLYEDGTDEYSTTKAASA